MTGDRANPWETRVYIGLSLVFLGLVVGLAGPIAWFVTHFEISVTEATKRAVALILGSAGALFVAGLGLWVAALVKLHQEAPIAFRRGLVAGLAMIFVTAGLAGVLFFVH